MRTLSIVIGVDEESGHPIPYPFHGFARDVEVAQLLLLIGGWAGYSFLYEVNEPKPEDSLQTALDRPLKPRRKRLAPEGYTSTLVLGGFLSFQ